VEKPVETLLAFINSDLKEFIRSHNYDDIVGDKNERTIEWLALTLHQGSHNTSPDFKTFFIADIVVKEKIGDQN
jgi:hypothetical protein